MELNQFIDRIHFDLNSRSAYLSEITVWIVGSRSWNLVIVIHINWSLSESSLFRINPEISFIVDILDLICTLQFFVLESGDRVLAPSKCWLFEFGLAIHRIVASWASNSLSIFDRLLMEISIWGLSEWEYGLLFLAKFIVWLIRVLIDDWIVNWSTSDRICNALSRFCASLGSSRLYKKIIIII